MGDWIIVVFLGITLAAWAIGYWLGFRHGVESEQERLDRMRRIDPPKRTEGLPTNLGGPPSDPRQPKWRTGQFRSGPPQAR